MIWLLAATDGACPRQADPRLRRAGCGLFFSEGHSQNQSWPLPGVAQTSMQAELCAVKRLLQILWRPTIVLIDCRPIVDGMQRVIRGDTLPQGKLAHFWLEVRTIYNQKVAVYGDCVRVRWIPSHRTEAQMNAIVMDEVPVLTETERSFNEGADKLAVQGAAAHMVPANVQKAAMRRFVLAVPFHHLIAHVLDARRCAAPAPARDHESYARNRPERCVVGVAPLPVRLDWVQALECERNDEEAGDYEYGADGFGAVYHDDEDGDPLALGLAIG